MNFKFKMIAKSSGTWVIGLFINFCIQSTIEAKKSEWLNNLVNYVQKDNSEYQIMLLFHKNVTKEQTKQDDIVMMISNKLPVMKISFQEATVNKAHELLKLPSLYTPRSTMYIIVHLSEENQHMTQLTDFVSQLSEARRRPRCLIIFSEEKEKFAYRKLLKQMWYNQFLDVTILELVETEKAKNRFSLNMNQEVAMLHKFNPFTKYYTRYEYSAAISWFPEKARNLHGRRMKVGVRHLPPSVFLEINNTGHVTNVYGKRIYLTQLISKTMNFKIDWFILNSRENRFSRHDCNKENLPGFLYVLVTHKVDYFSGEDARIGSCVEKLYEWSVGTARLRFVLVVPVSPIESTVTSTKWRLQSAFVLVSLWLLTWILLRMLPFNRSNFSLLQTMQIVISTPTLHEPRKLAERIVFGGMLLSCLMNSSFIYTAFTDTSLKEEKKFEMETIDDLIASNLETMVSSYYAASFNDVSEESIRLLLNKSTIFEGSTTQCLKRLIKERNVACVRRDDSAKWVVDKYRDNCGRPLSKIIIDPLKNTVTGMVMAPGSPYVGRFDEIIHILMQSGIVEKWEKMKFSGSSITFNEDESCKTKRGADSLALRRQITYLLLCGYACATIAFICEVFFAYLKRKSARSVICNRQ